jgi:hypothetical protein
VVSKPGFDIRNDFYSRGFSVTFANGCTVSVQFGQGNYCENRNNPSPGECKSAEIAALDPDRNWIRGSFFDNDDVYGWATPAQVLQLMIEVAAWEK